MPIIYSLVGKGSSVLVETSNRQGNFDTISRKILLKISQAEGHYSYIYDSYVFHYYSPGNICFMCLTDLNFNRNLAFSFLYRANKEFNERYGQTLDNINPYQYQDFGSYMRDLMNNYSTQSQELIERANSDLQGVKLSIEQNIDRILNKNEKIELLVDRVETISVVPDSDRILQRRAPTMKKNPWYKNILVWLVIVLILLILAIIILIIGCGGFTFKKCS